MFGSPTTGMIVARIVTIFLLPISSGYIWRSATTEPDCPGIHCANGGDLMIHTCTCRCPENFTGPFCNTERETSIWPGGRYALISPVFGCPESDRHGWYPAYVNLSLPGTGATQRWKMQRDGDVPNTADPHLLGPYYSRSIQINFCTRIGGVRNEVVWPRGSYCMFLAGEACPVDFQESNVTLGGYTATHSDIGGVSPGVVLDNNTVTIGYCCRDDDLEITYEMDLPNGYPFILFKVNGRECPKVSGMTVAEERFDFVEQDEAWTAHGNPSMFTKNGTARRLALCYYSHSFRDECYFEEDGGFSYNGVHNETMDGRPCLPWLAVDPDTFTPNKYFVGEFEENYCRSYSPTAAAERVVDQPKCYVNNSDTGDLELMHCNIPKCEVDVTLEKVGAFKPVYAVESFDDRLPEYAVDAQLFGLRFQAIRPLEKPWIQVDLEEFFEVHHIQISRNAIWFPVNLRFVGVHIGKFQWDFFNYGARQCQERRHPRKATKFRFVCYRPTVGQYVTIRNFDDPDPGHKWGSYYYLEIGEIEIYGRRTGCGRRLGMTSGAIRDFQLSGSSEKSLGHIFDFGRLLRPGSGWCANSTSADAYFMMDLILPMVVEGFEVQGWEENNEKRLPCELSLEYGIDENNMTVYQDPNGFNRVFRIDSKESVTMIRRFLLYREIVARFVKINILQYDTEPCLKIELIGCPVPITRDLTCSENSTMYGYDVIENTAFWMEDVMEYGPTSMSACRDMCQLEDRCLMFYYVRGKNCRLIYTTRYNPHYYHWLVQSISGSSVHTKLCLNGMSNITECQRLIEQPILLQSPSYPFYYGTLLKCVWVINFQKHASYIKLHIVDLNMAIPDTRLSLKSTGMPDIQPGNCIDTLTIDRMTITSANQTGFRGAHMISRESILVITLTTCERYSQTGASGFLINITLSDTPGCGSTSDVCMATCSQSSGVIMSPGFPAHVDVKGPCFWHIRGCSNNWLHYQTHCYKWFQQNSSITWYDAENICYLHGGHLVSIHSQQELMFVHHLISQHWTDIFLKGSTDIYIGLHKTGDDGTFGDFIWSDGSPVTFTAWYGGSSDRDPPQPNGHANERCTALKLSSIHLAQNWHDIACAYDKISQYICKVPLEKDTIKDVVQYHAPNRKHSDVTDAILFSCGSGGHILTVYRCDGYSDCADSSDEDGCPESCSKTYTGCEDGSCVSVSLWCDFWPDCRDGSDEINCVYPPCNISEWRCDSGQCISSASRCDLTPDCYDKSDEKHCASSPSAFQCYDQQFVPSSRVCDGIYDCSGFFHEDEPSGCSISTRFSCLDWLMMGFEGGQYSIDLGSDSGFSVECRLREPKNGRRVAETILHHHHEAPVTVDGGLLELVPQYKATSEQIELLLSQHRCRQHVSLECSYDTHIVSWTGRHGTQMGNNDNNETCACPFVEKCYSERDSCVCYAETNSRWYGFGHHDWLQDEGFITNHEFLPIKEISSPMIGSAFLEQIRTTLGPLVCEEDVPEDISMDLLVCANEDFTNVSNKCLLDFDFLGEVTGCRDLSHLRNCESFDCPAGYARCGAGYCIPVRLVCDGIKHCSNGEDEIGCEVNRTCTDLFRCHESTVCIPMDEVCSGHPDCPQRDDERMCHAICPHGCICAVFSVSCPGVIVDYRRLFLQIPATRKLDISRNPMDVNDTSFELLPYLTDLNISSCVIRSLGQYMFKDLNNLNILDVGHNVIEILLENTFYGLYFLKTLILSGNPLKHVQSGAFVGLTSLPNLDLSGSAISTLTKHAFLGLEHLEILNLNASSIRTVEELTFSELNTLKTLDLRGNTISLFGENIFEGLDNLNDLFTDSFTLCCVRPMSVSESNCWPPKNEFSSCDDLMRNGVLRAFLWIIGISALLGNIFVLVTRFYLDRHNLLKTHGIFVTNLSIADFTMGVYLIILAIADTAFRDRYIWNDYQWRHGPICQLCGVLSTLASEGSVVFLCLITIDRWLVIKYPFGNIRIRRRMAFLICVFTWLFLFVISVIPLVPMSYFGGGFYSRSAVCLALPLTRDRPAGWEYSVAIFIVFNCIAFIFIAAAQIWLYKEISSVGGKVTSSKRRQDMVIARNLFIIVFTDFLCWFPVGLMGILGLNGHVISGDVYAWIAVFVLPINSALNPFLYTLGSSVRKSRASTRLSRSTLAVRTGVEPVSVAIKDVFESDAFIFGQRRIKHTQPLSTFVSHRALSTRDALAIAWRVAKGLTLLHENQMVHGSLTHANVMIRATNDTMCGVAVKCSPTVGTEELEFANDVSAYGSLIKLLIKAVQQSK